MEKETVEKVGGLKDRAVDIRVEQDPGDNDAERVGSLLVDMLDYDVEQSDTITALEGVATQMQNDIAALKRGSGGSSSAGYQKMYFANVSTGTTPAKPSPTNYNPITDSFDTSTPTWSRTNTDPQPDQQTYAIWVYFSSGNSIVTIDGPVHLNGGGGGTNGEDGEELEWIYLQKKEEIPIEYIGTIQGQLQTYHTNGDESKAGKVVNGTWTHNKTGGGTYTWADSDVYPEDWTDNPKGVDEDYMYEYAAFRRSANNANGKRAWGDDYFHGPLLWSAYGKQGTDGDGVEYIFYANSGSSIPVGDLYNPSTWHTHDDYPGTKWKDPEDHTKGKKSFEDDEYIANGSGWMDEPIDLSSSGLGQGAVEWVSMRKKQDGEWQAYSIPAVWSRLAVDGIVDGYTVDLSNENMPVGTDYSGFANNYRNTCDVEVRHNDVPLSYGTSEGQFTISIGTITRSDSTQQDDFINGHITATNIINSVAGKTIQVDIDNTGISNFDSKNAFIPVVITIYKAENQTTTRNLTITMFGVAVGEAGKVIDLFTETSAVHTNAAKTTVIPADLDVGVRIGTGSSYTTLSAYSAITDYGYSFSYFYDDDSTHQNWVGAPNYDIRPSANHSSLTVRLLKNGTIIDAERLPYVIDGADGDSVTNIETYYHADASSSFNTKGVTNPNVWFTTIQAAGWSASYPYLFMEEKTTYSNGVTNWGEISLYRTWINDGHTVWQAEAFKAFDHVPVSSETGYKPIVQNVTITDIDFENGWQSTPPATSGNYKVYYSTARVIDGAVQGGISGWSDPVLWDGKTGDTGPSGFSLIVEPPQLIINESITTAQNPSTGMDYITDYTYDNATKKVIISIKSGNVAQDLYFQSSQVNGLPCFKPNGDGIASNIISAVAAFVQGSNNQEVEVKLNAIADDVSITEGYTLVTVGVAPSSATPFAQTIKIPFYINKQDKKLFDLESNLKNYADTQDGVLRTDYNAKISASTTTLRSEYTEQISKAGDYGTNLFGFHKGITFGREIDSYSNAVIPFIQGYGFVISSTPCGIYNLGFDGVGGLFTVSFYVKKSTSGQIYLFFDLCDVVPQTIIVNDVGGYSAETGVPVNDSWKKVILLFELSDAEAATGVFNGLFDIQRHDTATSDPIYIRHLMIERGNKANNFCEADEDIAYLGSLVRDSWTLNTGQAEETTDYQAPEQGLKVYKNTIYPASGDAVNCFSYASVSLTSGKIYTLSFYAKATSGSPADNKLMISLENSNDVAITDGYIDKFKAAANYITSSNNDGSYIEEANYFVGTNGDCKVRLTTSWRKYYVHFYCQNSVTASLNPFRILYGDITSGAYFLVSDVKFEEGYVMDTTYFSSLIEQTARRLSLVQQTGLTKAGIDIQKGIVNLYGDRVVFSDASGSITGKVWIDPSNGTLHAVDGDFSGTVHAQCVYTTNYYVNTNNVTLITDTGLANTFMCNAPNVYVPSASAYDGLEFKLFYASRENPAGARDPFTPHLLTHEDTDYILYYNESDDSWKSVKTIAMGYGYFYTIKSAFGYWYVLR